MGFWTVTRAPERCGADEGHDLPARQPVYVMAGKFLRCELHAPAGVPLDQSAIDAALHALEAEDAARTTNTTTAFKRGAPVLPGFTAVGDATEEFHRILKLGGGIKGLRPDRSRPAPPPKRHADVAHLHDPKARAVND